MKIEELAERMKTSNDEDFCRANHEAKRLIQEEIARCGGPDDLASTIYVLWRQGSIGLKTIEEGRLGMYKLGESDFDFKIIGGRVQ